MSQRMDFWVTMAQDQGLITVPQAKELDRDQIEPALNASGYRLRPVNTNVYELTGPEGFQAQITLPLAFSWHWQTFNAESGELTFVPVALAWDTRLYIVRELHQKVDWTLCPELQPHTVKLPYNLEPTNVEVDGWDSDFDQPQKITAVEYELQW